MSIAEKLQTIAENEPKVYNAGQLAVLENSKYMNGKESGAIVSVNDVTPIEHNVGVKLSSDTITDFTGVEVARYGKNLCSPDINDTFVRGSYRFQHIGNVPLIIKFYDKDTSIDVSNINIGWAYNFNNVHDGNRWVCMSGKIDTDLTNTDFAREKQCPCLMYYPTSEGAFNKIMQRWDIQVEYGGTQTEFEPFTKEIYTANADGTVEGVKSISPNMTLIPNNNAVTVECEYLRDIDLYIDNLITNVALTGGE